MRSAEEPDGERPAPRGPDEAGLDDSPCPAEAGQWAEPSAGPPADAGGSKSVPSGDSPLPEQAAEGEESAWPARQVAPSQAQADGEPAGPVQRAGELADQESQPPAAAAAASAQRSDGERPERPTGRPIREAAAGGQRHQEQAARSVPSASAACSLAEPAPGPSAGQERRARAPGSALPTVPSAKPTHSSRSEASAGHRWPSAAAAETSPVPEGPEVSAEWRARRPPSPLPAQLLEALPLERPPEPSLPAQQPPEAVGAEEEEAAGPPLWAQESLAPQRAL